MKHPAEAYCVKCGSPIHFDNPDSRRGICTFSGCRRIFAVVEGTEGIVAIQVDEVSGRHHLNKLEALHEAAEEGNTVMNVMGEELGIAIIPAGTIMSNRGLDGWEPLVPVRHGRWGVTQPDSNEAIAAMEILNETSS